MKKNKLVITITIIVIFIINILLNYLEYRKFTNITNNFVASIINEISVNYPNIDDTEIIEIINSSNYDTNSDILTNYGFTTNDLSILKSLEDEYHQVLFINITVFIIITLIIILLIYLNSRRNKKELNNIIKYLKELNRGNYNLAIDLNNEGELSILKNEIYTTTIMLREKAEQERQDKINLKDSLTNISHQLKTPLTSISLLVDNLSDELIPDNIKQEFFFMLQLC